MTNSSEILMITIEQNYFIFAERITNFGGTHKIQNYKNRPTVGFVQQIDLENIVIILQNDIFKFHPPLGGIKLLN